MKPYLNLTKQNMEDNLNIFLNGRQPQLFLNGRQPKFSSSNGRQPQFFQMQSPPQSHPNGR